MLQAIEEIGISQFIVLLRIYFFIPHSLTKFLA